MIYSGLRHARERRSRIIGGRVYRQVSPSSDSYAKGWLRLLDSCVSFVCLFVCLFVLVWNGKQVLPVICQSLHQLDTNEKPTGIMLMCFSLISSTNLHGNITYASNSRDPEVNCGVAGAHSCLDFPSIEPLPNAEVPFDVQLNLQMPT